MDDKKREYLARMGAKIKQYRILRGMTQEELALACGYTNRAAIAQIEKGRSDIVRAKFILMCDALGVTPAELLGYDEPQTASDSAAGSGSGSAGRIPVLSELNRGGDITDAPERREGFIEYSNPLKDTAEYYAHRINGVSMEPTIMNGDIIVLRKQHFAESGDLVVVGINGDIPAVRRFRQIRGMTLLIPDNPHFEPLIVTKDDNISIQILGKIVEIRRRVK